MGKVIFNNKILKIKQNDRFYSKRDTTALSDDQNHYTETPQGANREIVGKVFSFSIRFRLEYFGWTGFNLGLILDFGLYNKEFGLEVVWFCIFVLDTQGMFGNCFFPLFSVFKNNFLFLRLKNLFGNSKQAENKNFFQNLICEGN